MNWLYPWQKYFQWNTSIKATNFNWNKIFYYQLPVYYLSRSKSLSRCRTSELVSRCIKTRWIVTLNVATNDFSTYRHKHSHTLTYTHINHCTQTLKNKIYKRICVLFITCILYSKQEYTIIAVTNTNTDILRRGGAYACMLSYTQKQANTTTLACTQK